ncbi:hypothetical protein V8E53_008600 [Lactarius tabidus]
MCYPYIINICTAHIIAARPELDEAFIASRHQSVRRGLEVYAVIPSNLLWILSTTFVHLIPESKNLLGLSSTVPRMIPSYVMLHHYSLCPNVSVFFESLHWAQKYYKQMDDTNGYVITMSKSPLSDYSVTESHNGHSTAKVLNPSIHCSRAKTAMLNIMLTYGQENQSLMQLAQAQALPRLPSYVKETTCIQLKDYPIYPGLSDPSLMGEVQDDFMKYSTTSQPTCGNLLCNLIGIDWGSTVNIEDNLEGSGTMSSH